MKKSEWTIANVITSLEVNTCYKCAHGCESIPSCTANCFYKDAVIKAIQYLKELQELKEQAVSIPIDCKFVIPRNWERGTDESDC